MNKPCRGSGHDFVGPTWKALKNGISRKGAPTTIEPAGEYFEHFKDLEFCMLFLGRRGERDKFASLLLNRIYSALREWELGFFRVAAIGSSKSTSQSAKAIEIIALIVYNAVRGSGSRLPAFAERMRKLEQMAGSSVALHGLRGGPIRLMEVPSGRAIKLYRNLQDAVTACFAQIEGNPFQLESLHRVLSRPKSSYMIAFIEAEGIGEMLRLADYTPARFSHRFKLVTDELRSNRTEFGFVSSFNVSGESLERLKEEATAMGMRWLEIMLVEHGTDVTTPGQMIGDPFLLVTMQDHKTPLRDNLMELAVRFRQDHVLFVYRDGAIELIEPYHDTLAATFTDLQPAIRGYMGRMYQLPVVEVRLSRS